MQNNAYSKQLNLEFQLTCFIFLLKIGKMLWGYRKCQNIGVGRILERTKYLKQNGEIQ